MAPKLFWTLFIIFISIILVYIYYINQKCLPENINTNENKMHISTINKNLRTHLCKNPISFQAWDRLVWCKDTKIVINKLTGSYFLYPHPPTNFCDYVLCDFMMNQGYVDYYQNIFFKNIIHYRDIKYTSAHIIDVGAHLGEYMPSAIVNGISYSAIEGSPDLAQYIKSVVVKNNLVVIGDEVLPYSNNQYNEVIKLQKNLFQGYFSDKKMLICLQNKKTRYKFINLKPLNQVCSSGTPLHMDRYDLSYVKKKKCDNKKRFLAVKYDVMINLCSVANSTYFGDIFEYEYVIKKYREEFGFGFPECLQNHFWSNYKLVYSTLTINNNYIVPNETNTHNDGYNFVIFKSSRKLNIC